MHKISIPDDVISQVKAQRGRLNRYDRLLGPKTALVVIDLQNAFMLPGMPVEVPAARDIVPNVNRLARALRAAGGTVVWVQMTAAGALQQVHFQGRRCRGGQTIQAVRFQVIVRQVVSGNFGHWSTLCAWEGN